jgi:large subunit ribosomal protein L4
MPERRKKKKLKSTAPLAKAKKKAAAAKAKKPARVKKANRPVTTKAEGKDHALSVYDLSGKTLETIKVDPLLEADVLNTHVVYQAVLQYRAGEREGTASTKDRGHVRGGGKKPWRQKGTGQARHGSRRSPIWRGGGTTFGPSPRDYSYSVPSELKKSAVLQGVRDKLTNRRLILVDRLELDSPKTKTVAGFLKRLKLEKPLFLVEKKTQNLKLASRNVPGISVKTAAEVNALDVVSHKECVATKAAYSGLLKRLKS